MSEAEINVILAKLVKIHPNSSLEKFKSDFQDAVGRTPTLTEVSRLLNLIDDAKNKVPDDVAQFILATITNNPTCTQKDFLHIFENGLERKPNVAEVTFFVKAQPKSQAAQPKSQAAQPKSQAVSASGGGKGDSASGSNEMLGSGLVPIIIDNTFSGGLMQMYADPGDTVELVREFILEKTLIPKHVLTLLLGTQRLTADHRTLQSFNIQSSSSAAVFRLVVGKGSMPVWYNHSTKYPQRVFVNSTDKVEDLKALIWAVENDDPNLQSQDLLYGAQVLQNGRTLESYGLQRDSIVMFRKSFEEGEGYLRLYIKKYRMKTLVIFLKEHDTVGYLRAKIQDKEGISLDKQRLIFAGRNLDDEHTLREYNICDNATITLIPRMRG